MPRPSRRRGKQLAAGHQPDIFQWIQFAPTVVAGAAPAATPERPPSQVVQESAAETEGGQHVDVTLERVSTGGTRHHAHFRRSASGSLTAGERKAKSRARLSLFPEGAAAARQRDATRKRDDRATICGPTSEHKFCSKCKRWRWSPDLEGDEYRWHCRTWPSNRLEWWVHDAQPDDLGHSDDGDEADTSRWMDQGSWTVVCVECKHGRRWRTVSEDSTEQLDLLDKAFQEFQLSTFSQREVQVNSEAVRAHGFPLLVVPARTQAAPVFTPALVAARASGLVLEARIVDFGGFLVVQRAIQSWLMELGFDVTMTTDCAQIGVSCGYVAARATGIMFAAGSTWQSIDVSDAVEDAWIALGNALLGLGWVQDEYLETQHVYQLAQLFHEHAHSLPHQPWDPAFSQAFPSMEWPLLVGSLDYVARRISETVMGYVGRHAHNLERAFFVTNTQCSGHGGSHWISVAIAMHG